MAERHEDAIDDVAPGLVEVHVGQRRVVRTAAGEHHVVDGLGQVREELLDVSEVGHVEGRRRTGVDLPGRVAQAVRIAPGEHHLRAVRPGEAGGLEPHARAPADEHDGLAAQVLFVARVHGRGRPAGHGRSRVRAANTALVTPPKTRWADRSSPSVRASYSQIGWYTPASGRTA